MCLDTAIENDNQLHTTLIRHINSLAAYTISLLIAIRDIVFNIRIVQTKELIDKGNSRTSVNIIVTIYHDTFLTSHGIIKPIHRDIHILHQERIDEVIELRTEKALCRRFRRYSTLNKKTTKHRSDIEFLAQFARLSHQSRRWCIIYPLEMHDRIYV